ncbi:Male sterility [Macleaya cordata]|uniref:Fatty acyl-CoA reductase n=1 Tax=Macleaya cordata TaxID=56857 RepID=A0A200R7X1_MACCD|nr:Male sterility [Macleaya cordata]
MGAFFLNNPISVAPNLLTKTSNFMCDWCCIDGSLMWKKNKNKNMVLYCQSSSGIVKTSNGLPAILTERSSSSPIPSMAADQSSGLIDAGSLVLSPNSKIQEDVAAKDLVPYSSTTNKSFMEFPEGIGIVRFLKGKQLLITGATGFLGKVLIEKILRTVPDVGKIYVMIKAKSKEAAVERLKSEIITTQLFKCLQQTHGQSYKTFMLSKLIPVLGNVCESNLGIEPDLADEIANEVDIIVNSAANTTFDERYDVALDINTQGPYRLMTFAKRCTKLQLFLQVSTAYVNGQRQGRILEKPFCIGESIARERVTSEILTGSLPVLDVKAEIKLALESREALQENLVAQKMKELGLERARIFGWQDTYVFTKAMGEMLIDNMRGEIPVAIIRPSVIESTYKEPFPGWMEGNRMMDPIVLYYGKGQLTGFLVDPEGVLDVVPADMVVNATLAAMAKHGATGKPGINIYQIASSVVNPLVFQDLAGLLFEHFSSSPYMDSRGRPIQVPKMKLFSSMCDFSSHIWTEAVQRSGRVLAPDVSSQGKLSKRLDTICRKSVEQAKYLANIYEPYTFYGGRFDNSNTQKLMEVMSEEERRSFAFDVGSIDWRDYISNVHIPGLRRHVMKGRGTCTAN